MGSAMVEAAADPAVRRVAGQPKVKRIGPTSPLQLGMSSRLAAAARIAEADADIEFLLSVNLDEFGLDATLRLLDGLFDALETHYEGGPIRLALDCPAGDADQLIGGLIAVPRLDVRLISEVETDIEGLQEIEPNLPSAASRALRLLSCAAKSEQPLVLTIRPNIFPIRPFSARTLAHACALTGWSDRKSPLAEKRRAAPLRGPGLIARSLACVALAKLQRDVESLAVEDPRKRGDTILQIAGQAELGFWAPEAFPSTPPLIGRSTLKDLVWPWATVPMTSKSEPYFLCLEELAVESVENALQVVYGTLHR